MDLFEPLGKVLFYFLLMLIGAACFIMAERFGYVPKMCIIEQGAFEVIEEVTKGNGR